MNDTTNMTLPKTLTVPGQSVLARTFWIAVFGALTILGARVEIPHEPVPYTLQTMVVLLAGAFLGPRHGALSQLAYLAAGALGAPVFAGGAAGLARLIGPTGGYLLAFPLAAAIVGVLIGNGRSLLWTAVSMATGLLIIFVVGTLHLYAFFLHDASAAFNAGFLAFTWWDIVKLSAAAMTYHELAKRWRRIPSAQ